MKDSTQHSFDELTRVDLEYDPTSLEDIKAQLTYLIEAKKYHVDDFLACSEFTLKQLRSRSRKTDVRTARQVGVTWAVLGGFTLTDAGAYFGRDHSTAIWSMKVVLNALKNPKQFSEMVDIVEGVCSFTWTYSQLMMDSLPTSAVNLEIELQKRIPEIFK